jgi:hypothetical protein
MGTVAEVSSSTRKRIWDRVGREGLKRWIERKR